MGTGLVALKLPMVRQERLVKVTLVATTALWSTLTQQEAEAVQVRLAVFLLPPIEVVRVVSV